MEPERSEESARARMKELRVNWILTFMLGIHMAVCFILYLPTLHNFIVNPSNETCENPGLGGSEIEYSVVVSMTSIGSLCGALFALTFARSWLSYKQIMILVPSVSAIAFTIYGFSIASWMVMVARFFVGFARGLTVILFTWYYVSSSEEYNVLQDRLGITRSTGLKRTLTVIFAVVTTLSYIPLSGMVAFAAQFDTLNQFRWPAWFNIAFSASTALVMLVAFRDKHIPGSNQCKYSSKNECSVKKIKQKRFRMQDILLVLFLAYTGSIIDSSFRILETITSPLLSDYFGFDISTITYFTFGLTSLFPLSCLCLLLLERIKVSSHFVLLIAIVSNTCGLTLMSNWQSLGGEVDVCANFSTVYEITVKNECVGKNKDCLEVSQHVQACLNNTVVFLYQDPDFIFNSTIDGNSCIPCLPSDERCSSFKLEDNLLCPTGKDAWQSNDYPHLCLFAYANGEFQVSNDVNLQCNSSSNFHEDLIMDASFLLETKLANSLERTQCEANDECYWNPESIITGEYCDECPKLCRNKEKSLNFIQICFAVMFTTISVEMTRFTALPMMSKSVSANMKLIATCLYVLSGSISRLMTPLWFNTLYVATDRQTVVPCSVFLVLQIPVYIGFVFLCISKQKEKKNKKDDTSSEDTSIASSDDGLTKPKVENIMFDISPELENGVELKELPQGDGNPTAITSSSVEASTNIDSATNDRANNTDTNVHKDQRKS